MEEIYLVDPTRNSSLMEIVEKEVKEGTVRKTDSCSRAILWLSRYSFNSLIVIKVHFNIYQRYQYFDFSSFLFIFDRSLDFSVAILEALQKDTEQSLNQIIEEVYKTTLAPWHGWIASAAYKVINGTIQM